MTHERTLAEIVSAVRLNGPTTPDELRYAVAAFDVALAQMDISRHHDQLNEYFKAAGLPPRQYVGEANDPEKPAAVEWYRQTIAICGGHDAL